MEIIEVYEKILAQNPEYRKEIGAFYTPKFIVDYMVSTTFKKSFENKNYQEISQIKVLDPACGGGAFLVGAYNYLLEYHTEYKQRELSTEERISILRANIFGVDIDPEALKVCQKALLMTYCKTDSFENIDETKLVDNIKCSDFLLDESDNFTGFDMVIGNPPYIQLQSMNNVEEIYKNKYETFNKTGDIYILFFEKSLHLLKQAGCVNFITSNKWMRSQYGENFRNFILQNTNPIELIDLNGNKIFDKDTVDRIIVANVSIGNCIINKMNEVVRK